MSNKEHDEQDSRVEEAGNAAALQPQSAFITEPPACADEETLWLLHERAMLPAAHDNKTDPSGWPGL